MLDGAVEAEVAAGTVAGTAAADDADPTPCPVAVGPVTRVVGADVPGASFCARLVALPKPRSLPIIPPPGVPGVASPFPLAPLPFPVPAVPPLVPVPVFTPGSVLMALSSGAVRDGAGAAAAPPLDTDGRRVGAAESPFCVATLVVAAVAAVSSACARW